MRKTEEDPFHFDCLRKKTTDTQRLEFVCQFVKTALDTDGALQRITMLLGDAPDPDCECREAHCEHASPALQTLGGFRAAIDAAMDYRTPSGPLEVLGLVRDAMEQPDAD